MALAAALLVTTAASLQSQGAVRLPDATDSTRAKKPGPNRVLGLVVDTAGRPIAGAEVIVPSLVRRMLTATDGTFRVDSLAVGRHWLRVRKIGYAQQMREAIVDSTGGVIYFALTPVVPTLPAIVSSANRRGLSGHVADFALHAVEGATVQVLGAGLSTTTDADGSFFLPAPAGSYMVSIKKDSFATKLVSVTIPKDSGRQMNAWLQPFYGKIPKAQFWAVDDLRERAAWILPKDRVFYSHEDLVRLKIDWIYDAVASAAGKLGSKQAYSRGCGAIVNGGAGEVQIGMLTIDDVESVEVYPGFLVAPATTLATRSKSKYSQVKSPVFLNSNAQGAMTTMRATGGALAGSGGSFKGNGSCLGVYVWMR